MKRDMELIRQILLAVEEQGNGFTAEKLAADGYTEAQVRYHAYLICDAGLASGVEITSLESECPEWEICSLTWKGHEFLDAARSQSRWDEAKAIIGKIGGASLQIWVKVLREQAEQAVRSLLS